jgi:branched-subunit amino acid transport protein
MPDYGGSGLWLTLAGAVAVTYGWRLLGVLLSGRVNPGDEIFCWVTCIAWAMLAALVGRVLLLPTGPLTETPLLARLSGAAAGLIVYYLFGKRIVPAVAVAVGTLIAAATAFGG